MPNLLLRLRRLSDQFTKPRAAGGAGRPPPPPRTPTSVADFPSIEFENEVEEEVVQVQQLPVVETWYDHPASSLVEEESELEFPFLPIQDADLDLAIENFRQEQNEGVVTLQLLDLVTDEASTLLPEEPTTSTAETGNDEPDHNAVPEESTTSHNEQSHRAVLEHKEEEEPAKQQANRQLVSIYKGNNKGKEGEIVGMHDKRTYRILLNGTGEIVNVRITSTEPIPNEDNTSGAGADLLIKEASKSSRSQAPSVCQQVQASDSNHSVDDAVKIESVSLNRTNQEHLRPPDHANLAEEETTATENVVMESTGDGESIHTKVRLCAGKHRSKMAEVVGDGARKNLVLVRLENGTVCSVNRSSIAAGSTVDEPTGMGIPVQAEPTMRGPLHLLAKSRAAPQRKSPCAAGAPASRQAAAAAAPVWSIPETQGNTMTFGGFRVSSLRLDDGPPSEITMLGSHFGERLMRAQVTLSGRSNQKSLPPTVYDGTFKYELIAVKVTEDKEGGPFSKKRIMNCGYVRTEGPNLTPLDLQNELARLADFSRLPPRKIVSRLELFMSPARFSVRSAKLEDFAWIPETGNVGCGFISEEKLLEICSGGEISKAAASRVVAIQVRIFLPAMGLFKGVLVRKRTTVAPIELPPSMQKVPASIHKDALRGAAIVVCKNGVHPAPSSANEYIGRALDDALKKPPTKSFESKIEKELKDMVMRLWESMGVPRSLCRNYSKESLRVGRRNHAWIVGVADPTGCLPPDTVFVPGMKTVRRETLFVTRSPCVKYDDGRLLQHVVEQPSGMTNENWEWLNGLSFGCIIFSNPNNGIMSMPERIAAGDLDGDLYLVCWDEEILSAMNAASLPPLPAEDDGMLSTNDSDVNWLEHAQELMQDVGSLNDMGKLTGKLYGLGEKLAKRSPQGLRDPDAASFFDAYNQALEFKKHGCSIVLPRRLHTMVPLQLRRLLTDDGAQ